MISGMNDTSFESLNIQQLEYTMKLGLALSGTVLGNIMFEV